MTEMTVSQKAQMLLSARQGWRELRPKLAAAKPADPPFKGPPPLKGAFKAPPVQAPMLAAKSKPKVEDKKEKKKKPQEEAASSSGQQKEEVGQKNTEWDDDFEKFYREALMTNDEVDDEFAIVELGANGEGYSQSFLRGNFLTEESHALCNQGNPAALPSITSSQTQPPIV